jgi:hypothetical protein
MAKGFEIFDSGNNGSYIIKVNAKTKVYFIIFVTIAL